FVKDRQTGLVERVSLASGGAQPDDKCQVVDISADGRFVVFQSFATNLVSGDTNGWSDVFLHDRQTGSTERVSLADDESEGNFNSESGCVSDDGNYVIFWSNASNLVLGDTNGTGDIFLRDRSAARTKRVSIPAPGAGPQGNGNCGTPTVSADGRYVTFASQSDNWFAGDANGTWDVFVKDTIGGTLEKVGPVLGTWNGASTEPWISADGAFVAFASTATDILAPDLNGAVADAYVWRRANASVQRVSVSSSGAQANAASEDPRLSGNGLVVAFMSAATNLVPGDTNGQLDVFVRDLVSGLTTRVSIGHQGAQGTGLSFYPGLSDDGLSVGFGSQSPNLVPGDTNFQSDVFVHDRSYTTWTTYCTAKTNSLGCTSSISASGVPSASGLSACSASGSLLLNNSVGIFIYSSTGPAAIPAMGGWLCVGSPLVRTPGASTGGTPPPTQNCSGTLTFDVTGWIVGGNDPTLVPGQSLWGQFWSRDTGFAPPNASNLTNGIELTVGP
ncbi:MAG TPA: hypothetical protein VMT18_11350, partial [Planctomycetota bacterium]|nr:hypothetical protein [Planctomycetota bacterium]